MNENPFAEGLVIPRRPVSFSLVVFGASGDLASRKLYPALFSLYSQGFFEEWHLIGFGRRPWSDEAFRQEVQKAIQGIPASTQEYEGFVSHARYVQGDLDESSFLKLKNVLRPEWDVLYYCAVPPQQYEPITELLGRTGLSRRPGTHARIVVEKPFGRSGSEADRLNRHIAQYFDETEIFRIDHYLGKETVQNIATFRLGNTIFEPLWNHHYIHHVEITVAETVGVERRAAYYEQSGALRDMVQNHLLQLLALVAMEVPTFFTSDSVRDEKVKVLRSLRPIDRRTVQERTLRAQYGSGYIDGEPVPAYREEPGVAPDSTTETFAALTAYVDTWRWASVPFLLRTGKRLSRRLSEIAVYFKAPPVALFPFRSEWGNLLVFRIQPDEGLTLYVHTKVPGLQDRVRRVSMDFLYGSGFSQPSPDAYERLILDALLGDTTLFTRRDEVEASWAFIDPIVKLWEENRVPLYTYEAGSAGPAEITQMSQTIGSRWRPL